LKLFDENYFKSQEDHIERTKNFVVKKEPNVVEKRTKMVDMVMLR